MSNDEAGNLCRPGSAERGRVRPVVGGKGARILVVDPVLGSRLSLAHALCLPGVRVDTAACAQAARERMSDRHYALVLADQDLGRVDGLDFLAALRGTHPGTARALVTDRQDEAFRQSAIERAGLAFVVDKPVHRASLRDRVRELLGGCGALALWSKRPLRARAPVVDASPLAGGASLVGTSWLDARDELLVRGLLAGFNSCESEMELYALLHAELAGPLRVDRWLWIDDERARATRIDRSGAVELELRSQSPEPDPPKDAVADRESAALARPGAMARATRPAAEGATDGALACLEFSVDPRGSRAVRGRVWLARDRRLRLDGILREVERGLGLAFRRIREGRARAEAARRLAHRVSQELRTPVGALAHAIDRLRGEAERAGISGEWMDRVSSESRRVVEVVEHLEGEFSSVGSLDLRSAI